MIRFAILAAIALSLTACEHSAPLGPAHPSDDPRCKPGMPYDPACEKPPESG